MLTRVTSTGLKISNLSMGSLRYAELQKREITWFVWLRISRELVAVTILSSNLSLSLTGCVMNFVLVGSKSIGYTIPLITQIMASANSKKNHISRKPGPGMIFQAANDFDIDLSRSLLLGDKMTDIEAGERAGVGTRVLLSFDTEPSNSRPPTFRVTRLEEAIAFLDQVET